MPFWDDIDFLAIAENNNKKIQKKQQRAPHFELGLWKFDVKPIESNLACFDFPLHLIVYVFSSDYILRQRRLQAASHFYFLFSLQIENVDSY